MKLHLLYPVVAILLFCAAADARADEINISAARVPLNYENHAQRQIGRLEYRGGLSLGSSDARFGGLSSLLVSADGKQMLAASDRGSWFSAELLYDEAGDLSGIASAHLAPITGPDGKALSGRYRDAEALAQGADGAILIAFEQHHRILRFQPPDRLDAHWLAGEIPERLSAPAELAEFNSNAAMEGLAVLEGDGLLILSEGLDNERAGKPAWLLRRDQDDIRFEYKRAARFRPTGATRLPDGNILTLERRYTLIGGVAALLRIVPEASIRNGAVLDGPEIARLAPPLTVDNMEGIAVRRDGAGHTLVYLVSDDNFSVLQRTLLLMFELKPEAD
ncbi:MAG: esterase-like activity of phytase family protein [Rhodospirillaceae bacterium]|nr:esterase-like activity of phytase family protein [Rhodospirillaceae bacterium]